MTKNHYYQQKKVNHINQKMIMVIMMNKNLTIFTFSAAKQCRAWIDRSFERILTINKTLTKSSQSVTNKQLCLGISSNQNDNNCHNYNSYNTNGNKLESQSKKQ